MMDPIYRIKDHIVALNSVSYDDESGLERFLAEVRETIRSFFSDRSQYVTFLGSVHFRPVSVFSPTSDAVICWAKGKKQVRELLMVMLADAQAQFAYEPAGNAVIAAQGPQNELQEAERIVSGHIGSGEAAILPRIRIDLRDVNILDDRVARYLSRSSSFHVKQKPGPVLFFSGRDEGLNNVLADYLDGVDADIIRIPCSFHSGRSIQDQFMAYSEARMVIVALGEDCWLSLNGMGKEADISSPSPGVCFGLGYLAGSLGRGRLMAFYREGPFFRRPTDFFELPYVPVDKSHGWRHELFSRLKQNKIGMKDDVQARIYPG